MDWIQEAYTVQMRFYRGSAPVEVQWFRAAKDAQLFRGPNVFVSRWHEYRRDAERNYIPGPNDVGEVGAPPAGRDYDQGPNTLGYLGKSRCGSNSAWAAGGVPGVDAPLPLADDGSSACCGAITRPAMAGILLATGLLVTVFLGIELVNDLIGGDYLNVTKLYLDNESALYASLHGDGTFHLANFVASPGQTGVVSTGGQSFGGAKVFTGPATQFLQGIVIGDGIHGHADTILLGNGRAAITADDSRNPRVMQMGIGADTLGYGYAIQLVDDTFPGFGGIHLVDSSGGLPPLYVGPFQGQDGNQGGMSFRSGLWVGGALSGVVTGANGGFTGLDLTITSNILTLSGVLNVAHGGTGDESVATHAVVLGNDTLPFGSATVGLSGRVLLDQGPSLNPAFISIGADAEIDGFGDLTIQPGVITYSKIQDVAALSLLGNPTGADTIATEVHLGPGLAWSSDSITLTTLAVQSANTVLAGPVSGGSDTPTFRALVSDDIPALSAAKITSGVLGLAEGGTGADLSLTGGVGQYVTQSSAGRAFTVGVIPAADVPTISGGKIGSGTVGLGVGGTGTDLSATGGTGKLLFQETVGGAVTVRSLASADVPNLSAAKITSGTLALAVGGTAADLSGTGGGDTILAQPVLGGAVVPTSLAAMLDALGGSSGSFG